MTTPVDSRPPLCPFELTGFQARATRLFSNESLPPISSLSGFPSFRVRQNSLYKCPLSVEHKLELSDEMVIGSML